MSGANQRKNAKIQGQINVMGHLSIITSALLIPWRKCYPKENFSFSFSVARTLFLGELDANIGEWEKVLKCLRITETTFREIGMDGWQAQVAVINTTIGQHESDMVKVSFQTDIDLFRRCSVDG